MRSAQATRYVPASAARGICYDFGVYFRSFSALMVVLFAWAAELQLNDPDPIGWFAIYVAGSVVALLSALARPRRELAGLLALIALAWAALIVPELWHTWTPSDLGATMSAARPEIEYGREFVGLLILASYCVLAAFHAAAPGWRRRRAAE